MNEKITDDTFVVMAMHYYDNPQCHNIREFEEDLKKFLYLKKLITRYKKDNTLKERLILNHIIVLYNVFGNFATEMLFHKIDKSNWDVIVTFLVYLGRMPDKVPHYNITLSDIILDDKVIAVLRKLTYESNFR
jgi:hypothetical protein